MTYVVDTTSDASDVSPGDHVCATALGTCSLRAAIDESNRHAGPDVVAFSIAGGAGQTIRLTGGKIAISAPGLTIDGYTEPGASPNTDAVVSNAKPGVNIVGSGQSGPESLYVTTYDTTIRGLAFRRMMTAIRVTGPNATRTTIAGNFFGVDASGASDRNSGRKFVLIDGGAHENQIGLPTPAGRNVMCNGQDGVDLDSPGTYGNVVMNNLIGVSPDGTHAWGNFDNGVDMNFGTKSNQVGGFGPMEGNVISGNFNDGVEVSHGWNPALPPRRDTSLPYQLNDNRILGNVIGFRPDGAYDPLFRNGLCYPGCASNDNGQAVNIIDGANRTIVQGNWIVGVRNGLQITSSFSTGNVVTANHIGVSPTGRVGEIVGNAVILQQRTSGNVVSGNTIAGVDGNGIVVTDAASFSNAITGNSFSRVKWLALDLFPTGQVNVNGFKVVGQLPSLRYPVFRSVTRTRVRGSAPASSRVQIYTSTGRRGFFGSAGRYLKTVTATSRGVFTARVHLRVGRSVTAMASVAGNLSEFGPAAAVKGSRATATTGHIQASWGTCLGLRAGKVRYGRRLAVVRCTSPAPLAWSLTGSGSLRLARLARCAVPEGGRSVGGAKIALARCGRSSDVWRLSKTGQFQTGQLCLAAPNGGNQSVVKLQSCTDAAFEIFPFTR